MNEFVKMINGLEVRKIVGSWLRSGGRLTGSLRKDKPFIDWVSNLVVNGRNFTKEEVQEIYRYAVNITDGKLELEVSAEEFLKGV